MEGLLLAAGAGRRMGTPKALVSDDRGSWLRRAVGNLEAGGCGRVTVVLGAGAEQARALLDPVDGPRIVVADDWAEGMGASLRAGLRSLADSVDDALILSLVDLPDLVPEVISRVGAAAAGPAGGPAVLARAAYDGVPGHPVLLGRDHWPGVLESARGDQGARAYLTTREVALIECGDLATGQDVDSRP